MTTDDIFVTCGVRTFKVRNDSMLIPMLRKEIELADIVAEQDENGIEPSYCSLDDRTCELCDVENCEARYGCEGCKFVREQTK